jgi:hypothetical protein
MRKLVTAGLSVLLLMAAIPIHADAQGGRRGRGAKPAKAARSSGTWGAPKASAKKQSSSKHKKKGIVPSALPKVAVPKASAVSGGRRRAGGMNTGNPSSIALSTKRASAAPQVNFNAGDDKGRKAPKLVNGGLDGGGGASPAARGGGKKRGGGKRKG